MHCIRVSPLRPPPPESSLGRYTLQHTQTHETTKLVTVGSKTTKRLGGRLADSQCSAVTVGPKHAPRLTQPDKTPYTDIQKYFATTGLGLYVEP